MHCGGRVAAKAIDTQHRRSPLIQGGLEIQNELTVEMNFANKNQLCLERSESLVSEKYKKPVDGATSAILHTKYNLTSSGGDP